MSGQSRGAERMVAKRVLALIVLVCGLSAVPSKQLAAAGRLVLTPLQKQTIQSIQNIFISGSPHSPYEEYGKVTLARRDLIYGHWQKITLTNGQLYRVIKDYAERPDGRYKSPLEGYLDRLSEKDPSLSSNPAFRGLLQTAGKDPVMRQVQDAFLERIYWDAAISSAEAMGVREPLGVAVIFDSHVHGLWSRMRRNTDRKYGTASEIGERTWIARYVEERRKWLSEHPDTVLRPEVYRMDAFRRLIDENSWALALPLEVQDIVLTASLLGESGRAIWQKWQDAEAKLESTFRQAAEALAARFPGGGGSPVEHLRSSQHGWLEYRDAKRRLRLLLPETGSLESSSYYSCILGMTAQRIRELEELAGL